MRKSTKVLVYIMLISIVVFIIGNGTKLFSIPFNIGATMWVAGYAGVFFSGLTLGLLPFFRAFFQGFREALDQARYKRDRPLYSGDFKTKEEWELYASQHPDQYELRHSDVPFSDVSKLFDDDYPGYDYWTAKDY